MARRILVGILSGGLIGAVLCAGAFLVGALMDGTRFGEAFGFSLVVAVIGAFLGGIAGAIIGLGNLGRFGGALVGLLVSLAMVALYVLGFGREGQYGRFLNESRVIIAGLTVPLILTGTLTAWLNKTLGNRNN